MFVDFYAVFPKKNTKLRQVTCVHMTGAKTEKMAQNHVVNIIDPLGPRFFALRHAAGNRY